MRIDSRVISIIFSLIVLVPISTFAQQNKELGLKTVVIDPGHGGKDGDEDYEDFLSKNSDGEIVDFDIDTTKPIFKNKQGVNFCGYRIYETHTLVRNNSKKKMKRMQGMMGGGGFPGMPM